MKPTIEALISAKLERAHKDYNDILERENKRLKEATDSAESNAKRDFERAEFISEKLKIGWEVDQYGRIIIGEFVRQSGLSYVTIYAEKDAEKLRTLKRLGKLVNPRSDYHSTDSDGNDWLRVFADVEGAEWITVTYLIQHDPLTMKCRVEQSTEKTLVCPIS